MKMSFRSISEWLDSLPVDRKRIDLEELVEKVCGEDSLARAQLEQLKDDYFEDPEENTFIGAGFFLIGLFIGCLIPG